MAEAGTRFVGIDWSGARGTAHKGIAVAVVEADILRIVPPKTGRFWSRRGVMDWLLQLRRQPGRTIVGFDSAFAFPHADQGHYGLDVAVSDAAGLWREAARYAQEDTDFYARPFAERHGYAFHSPGKAGDRFSPRLRVCEAAMRGPTGSLLRMESVYRLVGASQVGLGALSVMALLYRMRNTMGMRDTIAVWPFDDRRGARMVVLEVYSGLMAEHVGERGKLRNAEELAAIAGTFGYKALDLPPEMSEHACDASLIALALARLNDDERYWNPKRLTDKLRAVEGWVFGVE